MKIFPLVLVLIANVAMAQDRPANHLAGAQSPYLLQHQYNPVDWYPWGQEALERARSENKLIFVSVGYASCHWCRVMADESFENQEIADILNAHFISIKIDRERRPDLDEQFMVATQMLTGGGGWPNSVFLGPTGEPFFGGTYFPPETFQSLLGQLVALWQEEPETVRTEGTRVATRLRDFMTRQAEARELTPDRVYSVAQDILGTMDPFGGGIGETAKFPQEPLFLFLLDQAERQGDRDMLAGVTNMLDAMIRGGIHDHVGGGFHRYAVDPDWRVPHFEKMLYNQALTGRLLVRSWAATGAPAYRRAADRLFAYVLRDLRDGSGAFQAAQDADSDDGTGAFVEGAYYTWTTEELGDHAQALAGYFDLSDMGDLDGAHVLNLLDDPDRLAQDKGESEDHLYDRLDPILNDLLQQRAKRIKPHADQKILMDWNGAMIATLAEASYFFGNPAYLAAAEQAANHILTHMKSETGYARVWFNGQANTPAQLADYASFGLALVALHDFSADPTNRQVWLDEAQDIANQIRTRFGKSQGGFRMTQTNEGFSPVIPLDDGNLASGNAMAVDLFARVAKRRPAPEMEQAAIRLTGALSGHALAIPVQRGATLKASQDLQSGETGPVRYVSSGAVRVAATIDRGTETIRLDIDIANGWHLNAHKPLEDYFIPVDLMLGDNPLPDQAFPDPLVKSLGFNALPLALYEGRVTLRGPVTPGQDVVLTLQACSDEICLQPEELRFHIW